MKVVKHSEEEIKLILETTSQDKEEVKELFLPAELLLRWYPLNINYTYKYSTSKDIMYLVKDSSYEGKPLYEVKKIKQAKALPLKDGVPFNKSVYQRNVQVVNWAKNNGLIQVNHNHVLLSDAKEGILNVLTAIEQVKKHLVSRFIMEEGKKEDFDMDNNLGFPKYTDELIYEYATVGELETLTLLGEVYTLLNLVRRLEE